MPLTRSASVVLTYFETVQLTCQRIGDICNMKLSDIRDDGTALTFHEQRSLSERLYREQSLDTQNC